MTRFSYSAVDAAGIVVGGELEAASRDDAVERLRTQGQRPLKVAQAPQLGLLRLLNSEIGSRDGLAARARTALTRDLAVLIEAGVPLEEALAMATRRQDRPTATLLWQIHADLRSGHSLSAALARRPRHFPAEYVSVLRASEEAGALGKGLSRLATVLAQRDAFRKKLVAALAYPAFLIVAASASLILLVTTVLPQFEPLFRSAKLDLPFSLEIMRGLGSSLEKYGTLLFFGIVLGAAVLVSALMSSAGRRAILDQLAELPLASGLLRRFETVRFADSLSLMLSNSVPLLRALTLAGESVLTSRGRKAARASAEAVQRGENLATALSGGGAFEATLIDLVRIGEQTGRVPDLLAQASRIVAADTTQTLDRTVALIGPAVTILVGAAIGFFLLTLISAVYGANLAIQ